MTENRLPKDPYNLIITGVGGQGNVMASRVLGNMMVKKGFHIYSYQGSPDFNNQTIQYIHDTQKYV